jgi:hypothetical protein
MCDVKSVMCDSIVQEQRQQQQQHLLHHHQQWQQPSPSRAAVALIQGVAAGKRSLLLQRSMNSQVGSGGVGGVMCDV